MKSKKNIKSIVILAGISIIALFFINMSFAANTAKISVETANLREKADTNSKILELLGEDQEVTIIEKEGDWYKVRALGITGYLRQDVITLSGSEQNATTQTNKEPTTNSSQEEPQQSELEKQPIAENQENQGNQENQANEPETNAVSQNKDEKTKKVAEDTKLKIVPAINATDTIEVKKDQEVTIIEKMNGWVCIEVNTVKGWIREEKLKSKETEQPSNDVKQNNPVQPLKTLYVNTETVNLRQQASTESEVVAKLKLNTTVEVYEELEGWYKVKVEGKDGYISASLLSDKKQEITTSRSSTTVRKANSTNTKKAVQEPTQTTSTSTNTSTEASKKGATVVQTAQNYIGSRYVYGATGPNSFDCSGFTSYIYRQHGVSLNRTAAGQYSNGTAVARGDLQLGDLVMFGKSGINHVAIYIGGGSIVHAANSKRGVTVDTINSGYYNNNYVGARRIIQ